MGLATGFGVSQKNDPTVIPPPGPPFAATSANDGLSVDSGSGKIVLGQVSGDITDPAALIDDREIPLDGHLLLITDSFQDVQFRTGAVDLNDFSTSLKLTLQADQLVFDNTGLSEPFAIIRDDTNALGKITAGALDLFTFDLAFGEIRALQNFFNGVNGAAVIKTDLVALVFQAGDTDHFNNHTEIYLDDSISQILLNSFADIKLGDISSVITGTQIKIDVVNSTVNITGEINGTKDIEMLHLDASNSLYAIGDIQIFNNGTLIQIDDAAGTIGFNRSGLAPIIEINGVPAFSGTVSPVNSITVMSGIVMAVS